jgi:hypothetical protein
MGVMPVRSRSAIKALACLLTCLCTLPARAAELPPLTPEQSAALALGIDAAATPDNNPGFDALLAHTNSWGDLMRLWSAGTDRPKDSVQVTWLESLVDAPDPTQIGTDAVLFGKLIERSPVPQRALVERWIIEPLDTGPRAATASRAIVLYIARPVSVILNDPQPGWFVRAGARFAGTTELPRRDAGPSDAPGRYAAFIGATYEVSRRPGQAPSGIFVWVGLLIAVLLAVAITLMIIIQKSRRAGGVEVLRNRSPRSDRDSSP